MRQSCLCWQEIDLFLQRVYCRSEIESLFLRSFLIVESYVSDDGKKRNTIPEDTWNVTLDFVNQISCIDDYDTEGAWPTLLDEFVEFAREKEQQVQKRRTREDEQMQVD